jgi:hypothetical protein
MRLFKTMVFGKFARSQGLTDEALLQAAREVERDLVDAKLGGNLYKKRVALPGRGKRGGARTILVYRKSPKLMFFLYGFPKNEKANLTASELTAYKKLEKEYSNFTEEQINTLIRTKDLEEVENAGTGSESG